MQASFPILSIKYFRLVNYAANMYPNFWQVKSKVSIIVKTIITHLNWTRWVVGYLVKLLNPHKRLVEWSVLKNTLKKSYIVLRPAH